MNKKSFEERVNELKEKYIGFNDFDYETIIKLEDEYNQLIIQNPEHIKRRSEILHMRNKLLSSLKNKEFARRSIR